MTAFLWGAAGAVTVLFLAGLFRRVMWRRWRGRGRLGARHLLRRLGARPDQERTVLAEADALFEALHALGADARALRGDLADLIAAPAVDAARVTDALETRLVRVSALRARFADAVSRIHAALDPAQRTALSELIRKGPRRAGCGWRGAHA